MDLSDIIFDEDRKKCAYNLMNMGYLNEAIEGYLIEALSRTKHWHNEIDDVLDEMPHVLDTISAEDAAVIANNWRQ